MDDRPATTTTGNPAISQREIQLKANDGTVLSARFWARANPRASLVIAHGLGEHGGCYASLAEEVASTLDMDVFAFDFRGHGRSSGKRGVVRRYDDLGLDIQAALGWIKSQNPDRATFLLGHSNGGLASLRFLLGGDRKLAGLILSNPALKLMAEVPAWKRLLGAILLRVAPGITLDTSIPDENLTADPAALAVIASDPLRHGRINPPFFFGMMDAGPATGARAGEIIVPMLMILGGSDPLIDPEVNRRFFEHLGATDKTLKVYPEMKHEPLQEHGREVVVNDILRWIGDRLV